ncbi:MAG TPA: outer membrane lipoprotein carrier protein LolA [Longimicrobiales bacterium]
MRPTRPLRRGTLSLLGAVLAGPSCLAAQAPDAYGPLEAAEARYAAVEALCADFHQSLSVPLLGEEREGAGRLCQERPNLFSMRFGDPEGDAIVVDGDFAWLYTPSQNPGQVLRTAAGNIGSGLDFHGEFLENPREKYRAALEATEMVAGRDCHRILLEPRNPASYEATIM